MEFLKNILSVTFILIILSSCMKDKNAEIKTINLSSEKINQKLDPNAVYSKAVFNIKGMTCEMGCAKTIEKKLAKMDGMKSAVVDFKNEMASVEFDVAKLNHSSITKAVNQVSDIYSVENMQTLKAASTSN
ncbi:MAG: heavy-metal-associated domain-containing protein [Formosa sp.]|jgi:Cu+-exporting ATPase|nr:heavy-metal-associated domain-containing protein [Formosa sp.]|tara:strand:- start:223 stop:615 length:393 start_codon:yes stop_codon:yes gene_type:complete